MEPPRYTSVDDLQAQLTVSEAANLCGVTLDAASHGRQLRLDCPFGCPGDHASKREVSVNTENPQKVFCCHAYGCQVRGNLLLLMHGWLTGGLPTGGKLKGQEFNRVKQVLTGTVPEKLSLPSPGTVSTKSSAPSLKNRPLAASDNEKARELVTLDEKFITDVGAMPPAAASYVRGHPCLSPASMQKWRVGLLPQDGGGDKRGWSLRGQLLYPILSAEGELLAWVSRDPQFETKDLAFNALAPTQRGREKKPIKHRFPVDFHRGMELFGQHASRLQEPGYREHLWRTGILVVEGFNDVIGLDNLGIPAVAIMSNKITDEQVTKVEQWSRQLAQGRVTLLFDADDAGDEGAKEALWRLAQRGLDVRLAWTQAMHGDSFRGRQPESLTHQEWQQVIRPAIERSQIIR